MGADRTIYNDLGTVEEMSIELCDLSVAKTMTKENAGFIINSYIEASDIVKYNVSYELDGKNYDLGNFTAVPYEHQKTEFKFLNLKNGIYNVIINVKQGQRVAASLEQRLVIMDGYEHQFMDELSGYGINVHFNQSQRFDYSETELQRLQYAGIKRVREAIDWRHVELIKGKYDWGRTFSAGAESSRLGHTEYFNKLQEYGIDQYRILGYANYNYQFYPEDDPENVLDSWNKRGLSWWGGGVMPTMPDGLSGWENYVEASVDHWGEENDFEIFNETQLWSNLFPKNVGNANTYTTLLKFSTMGKISTGVKGYNADINGFSVDQAGHWQLTESLKQGVYPYVSSAGTHAYVHPNDPDYNDSFRREIKQVRQDFVDYGGWKDVNLSEFGWTFREGTNLPFPFVKPELAAKYLVKNFVLADDVDVGEMYWYVYARYRETEETLRKIKNGEIVDSEQSFGLFNIFYEPQPTYLAFTEMNRRLAGAIYLGEVSLGIGDGERAFLYAKDGKPVLVVWYYDGNDGIESFDLKEAVNVYDIYGNLVHSGEGSFEVTNDPRYVEGLSNEWFKKCINENFAQMNKDYIKEYAPEFSDEFATVINETFKNAENKIEENTTDDTVFEVINEYAELGNKIIEQGRDGKVTHLVASKTLFKLYEIMCFLDNGYIPLYDGEMPEKVVNNDITPLTEKMNNLYRNDNRLMPYSDEMHRHAKRFVDNVNEVFAFEDNPQKAGVVAAYDLMAGIVINWTDKFSDMEEVMRHAIFAQVPYKNTVTTSGFTTKADLSVFNYEKEPVNLFVKLVDEEGNLVVETKTVTVEPSKFVTLPVSFIIEKDMGVDTYYYRAEIYDENGEYISTSIFAFSVSDSLDVNMKPIDSTPDKATNLVFEIENFSNDDIALTLNIKSNEDVKFGQSSVDFMLEAHGKTSVSVPIVSMTNTKFHYYTAEYSIVTDNGEALYEASQPINFSCITKATSPIDVKKYDGSLDGWEDAYPVYINAPKNANETEGWKTSNLSARVLYKWDESNLYMLADVFDNRLYNALMKSDMWNGDCIQMSFDTGNEKSKAYDSNDLEMGFAITSLGDNFHVWNSPEKYTGSPTPEWLNIIRNDDNHITRYVVAIPKSLLPGMSLANGFKFGYNVGMNDADTLYRERWEQLTNGTIDSKNPSLYETFTLIDDTNKDFKEGIAASIFINSLESNTNKIISFEDIGSHWSENQVTTLYGMGIVNGKSETQFDPNGTLTRAEFMQMAALASKEETGAVYNIYADVNKDDWYAEAVQILYENDIIPEEMIADNALNPNEEITREEAAVIAFNVYKAVKNRTVKTGQLELAPDGDSVSEWAREGVDKAMKLEIIVGDETGAVNPQNHLTRAEGATVIFKLIGEL